MAPPTKVAVRPAPPARSAPPSRPASRPASLAGTAQRPPSSAGLPGASTPGTSTSPAKSAGASLSPSSAPAAHYVPEPATSGAGRVQVFVRVRPLAEHDAAAPEDAGVKTDPEGDNWILVKEGSAANSVAPGAARSESFRERAGGGTISRASYPIRGLGCPCGSPASPIPRSGSLRPRIRIAFGNPIALRP